MTCCINDCDRQHYARGWCHMHWKRWQRTGTTADPQRQAATCSIEGCDRPTKARGWCGTHYARWRLTGDPCTPMAKAPNGTRPSVCTIRGCQEPHSALGWCSAHYQRYARYGDPTTIVRPKQQGDAVGYNAVHTRLVADRGRPQRCDQCGTTEGRIDWALMWRDVDPMTLLYDVANGHHHPYSLNLDAYGRLCATCHRNYDKDASVERDGVAS